MNRKNFIIRCFVVHVVVTAISASTGLLADDATIWEAGANEFIKYAERSDTNYDANDHPVNLNEEDISKALEALKIPNKRGSEEQQPVFTVEQVRVLSQNLATGLAHALPNQDIHFALQKSVKRRFGLKPRRMYIAGTAFYKDDGLNIIIGDYDRPADAGFEAAYDPTHVGIVRYHFNQGSRAKNSNAIKVPIVPMQGIENKQLSGTTRPDWFVVNLNTASIGFDEKTAAREREEQATTRKEIEETRDRSEAIAPRPAAAAPAAVKSPESAKESAPPAAAEPPPIERSFEERLQTLNRLRDEGLITEAEYAAKRQQILDEL